MPPRKPVRHGTRAGYDKHRRVRSGRWDWPACDSCQAAYTIQHRTYLAKPASRARARERNVARQRSYHRLRDMHQGDYARLYTEELSLIRDGGKVILSFLEGELASLLGATSMAVLARAVAQGAATQAEHQVFYRARELERRIAEVQARIAVREAGEEPAPEEGGEG